VKEEKGPEVGATGGAIIGGLGSIKNAVYELRGSEKCFIKEIAI
jgi:hypothetical protein